MLRIVKIVFRIGFTFLKFCFLKMFHWKNFKFSLIGRFFPNVTVEIDNDGKLSIGKDVRALSGCKIKIRSNGMLVIGDGCAFNHNCIVVCHDSISIGKGTLFGPDVKIYDHDHDYRADGGIHSDKYKTSEIVIGDNCWIGANTVILRGTVLGNNCVVGAGSVLRGKYSDGSVIVQKRNEIVYNGTKY